MRIVFIWVEEYKKLNDFQTSFCGEFNIKYKNGKLNISKNNLYIENFFKINESNIKLNLSAIVGENGTGKSSILDLIREYIKWGMFPNKYIIIFEDNGYLFIDCNFDIFQIKANDEVKYEIIQNEFLDKYLSNQITMVFSNVFDARYFAYSDSIQQKENNRLSFIPEIKNISTNALMASYSETEDFLNLDFSKQIFFVNEYKSVLEVEKLVKIPEKIYIKYNSLEYHYENFTIDLESFVDAFKAESVASFYFNLDVTNSFKEEIITVLTQSFCIDIGYLLIRNNFDDLLLIETYVEANSKFGENFFEIIHKNLIANIKRQESSKTILKLIKSKLDKICKSYIEMISLIDSLPLREDEAGWFIHSNSNLVNEFINYYKDNFYNNNILNFYWSEMSSGQFSLLNLFGRFYDSLNEVMEDIVDETNNSDEVASVKDFHYLLLIDECDLYFHPQWQKDWLYYFLKLIEILFEGNVQVILTTHSPFILSDFPNNNVTFLANKTKKLTLKNEIEGSPRTFGANINELFTNSFFISDGLMGKFAKNKINTFIRDLMNASPDKVLRNKTELRKFIDIIGEPLIKNKLLQIYNEKLQLASDDTVEKRIQYLENEINILKRKSGL